MYSLNSKYKWFLFVVYAIGSGVPAFVGVVILILTFASAENIGDVLIFFLFLGIPAFYLVVYALSALWVKNYKYEMQSDFFYKEYGILTKRNTNIPYARIQNIDIISPLLMRIFGLSALNIQTAGGASDSYSVAEGRLPGLSKEVALQLRQELIDKMHGSQKPNTPNNSGL